MSKFCSNCGKELNENADVCLNCGVSVNKSKSTTSATTVNTNDEKKKGLPGWAVALIVIGALLLLLLGILFSFGMFAYNTVRSIPAKEMGNYMEKFKDTIEEAEENAKSFVEEYNENTDVTGEGTVGDTLEIDGMKFTLTKVKEVLNNNSKYLVCFFEIENNSSREKVVSYLNFNLEADNELNLPEFLVDKIDGIENLNKTIELGEKATGYVAFAIEDNYKELEVSYHRYPSNNKITFKIDNNQIRESA